MSATRLRTLARSVQGSTGHELSRDTISIKDRSISGSIYALPFAGAFFGAFLGAAFFTGAFFVTAPELTLAGAFLGAAFVAVFFAGAAFLALAAFAFVPAATFFFGGTSCLVLVAELSFFTGAFLAAVLVGAAFLAAAVYTTR